MKKFISIMAAVAFAANISLGAAANDKGANTPKNDKGTELPKNDKGGDVPNNDKGSETPVVEQPPVVVPPEVVAEMCEQIGYDFGPGDLTCNRNWFRCTDAQSGVDFVCNLLPELPVNVIKIPFYAVQEAVKLAGTCVSDASKSIGPFAILLAVPCLGLGALKGGVEGVVGTVAGFFEITGDQAVFHLETSRD